MAGVDVGHHKQSNHPSHKCWGCRRDTTSKGQAFPLNIVEGVARHHQQRAGVSITQRRAGGAMPLKVMGLGAQREEEQRYVERIKGRRRESQAVAKEL